MKPINKLQNSKRDEKKSHNVFRTIFVLLFSYLNIFRIHRHITSLRAKEHITSKSTETKTKSSLSYGSIAYIMLRFASNI
jgi:hypothetical protein